MWTRTILGTFVIFLNTLETRAHFAYLRKTIVKSGCNMITESFDDLCRYRINHRWHTRPGIKLERRSHTSLRYTYETIKPKTSYLHLLQRVEFFLKLLGRYDQYKSTTFKHVRLSVI